MRRVRRQRGSENQTTERTSDVKSGMLPMYSDGEGLEGYRDEVISDGFTQQQAEDQITHVVILPNYMEDIGTLRETLMVLASHGKAKSQYEVRF